MNLSAKINPFIYSSNTIEIIALECVKCNKEVKECVPHDLPNTVIMRDTFKFRGWTAKRVYGAKKTVCPKCRKGAK